MILFWPYQVSYGSELSNRGPTFDMDLSDFMDGEQPISYQKAKEYFAKDPSQKWVTFMPFIFQFILLRIPYLSNSYFRWAAYVAGVILVLMTELGVHFENSISMLVKVSPSLQNIVNLHV